MWGEAAGVRVGVLVGVLLCVGLLRLRVPPLTSPRPVGVVTTLVGCTHLALHVVGANRLAGPWPAGAAVILGVAASRFDEVWAPPLLRLLLAVAGICACVPFPSTPALPEPPSMPTEMAYVGLVGACACLLLPPVKPMAAWVVAAAVVVSTALGGGGDHLFYLSAPLAALAAHAHVLDYIIPTSKTVKTVEQTDVVVYMAALGVAGAFACVRSQRVLWAVQALGTLGLAF